MTSLVVGATGATGTLLVRELLQRGETVKALVRSPEKLSDLAAEHERLQVVPAAALDLAPSELVEHVTGCRAVASCLGHNLTFAGIYGAPRRLVTDTTARICEAIRRAGGTDRTRFVLMNTTGNRNRDLEEPVSIAQHGVLALLRLLLPPHVDNESAADYLRLQVGRDDPRIEWAAVRPDNLVDEDRVTGYEAHRSPTRSAIFDAGKTSRINVAHFMAELMTDSETWATWKGEMPVIYNKAAEPA